MHILLSNRLSNVIRLIEKNFDEHIIEAAVARARCVSEMCRITDHYPKTCPIKHEQDEETRGTHLPIKAAQTYRLKTFIRGDLGGKKGPRQTLDTPRSSHRAPALFPRSFLRAWFDFQI